MNMQLKDKIIVITGANRGLGRCLADVFLEKGAKVVAASRTIEGLTATDSLVPVLTDVTKEQDQQNLAARTIEKFGRIDIWINNAGIWIPHVLAEEMDMKRVHEMFEVNLFGTMYGSIAALRQMRQQGSGIIVNIISTSALQGRPTSSAYAASKFAADGFTKSINLEAKDAGIKVIAVYPGGMKTHLFDENSPADYAQYMDPKDVAAKIIANLELDSPEEAQILKRQ